MATREPIFAALYARGCAITWTDPVSQAPATWGFKARRLATADQIGAYPQPAFMQGEGPETFSQVSRMPSKRLLSVSWLIYLRAYSAPDPTGPLINAVMDGVEAALAPDDPINSVCTLGGLVSHAWIDGDVFKDAGDLDGQAMLICPIKLLIP